MNSPPKDPGVVIIHEIDVSKIKVTEKEKKNIILESCDDRREGEGGGEVEGCVKQQ